MADESSEVEKEFINRHIVKICQKISWLIFRPVFKLFARLEIQYGIRADLLKSPMIIVANHCSHLDPVIVGLAFSFDSNVHPVYFMTKDTIIKKPIWGWFLKKWGAFPAFKGEGLEKSLAAPKRILMSGQSVVIFPQGRIFPDFQLEQGRPGAAALALAIGKPVLPMAILGISDRISLIKFLLGSYRIKIVVGQPFLLKDKLEPSQSRDLSLATAAVMGEVKNIIKNK